MAISYQILTYWPFIIILHHSHLLELNTHIETAERRPIYAPPPHLPPVYSPIFPSSSLDAGRHKLCLRLAPWTASHMSPGVEGSTTVGREWEGPNSIVPPSMGLLSSASVYESINRSISSEVETCGVYFRLLFAATMYHQLGAVQQSITGGSVAIYAGAK
jgi:hypothetical protein